MTEAERIVEQERVIAELRAKDVAICEELTRLRKENEEWRGENVALREELTRLRKEIEEWRRGHRERKKRRSSKTERKRPRKKKRPGRKKGHAGASRPTPKDVSRTVEHPLPATHCECGGCVEPTDEQDSVVVTDIPPVKPEHIRHVAPVGRCVKCGGRIVAKLPGSTGNGSRVVESVIGPNAQALMVSLRFEGKMTLPSICKTMDTWFGIAITPGGLAQLFHRTAERAKPSYDAILAHVRQAPVVGADETGLRQDGVNGWAWLVRTDQASLFRIELSRGAWVIDAMLGGGFVGVVCTDFYGAYTRHADWTHQYCNAHVVREAKKIAEVSPTPESIEFCDRLLDILGVATMFQVDADDSIHHGLRVRLGKLIADKQLSQHADVARLQARLDEHFHGVLHFLGRPNVPPDNNATERDIRFLAHYRKVTGGTRSATGSETLARMLSVTQTLHKNDLPLRDYIVGLNDSHLAGRSPPSVFRL